MWNYITFLRENKEIANKYFEYVSTIPRKNNTVIMEIIDKLCNGIKFEIAIKK